MEYPTIRVLTDGYGERMYCAEYKSLRVFHRQPWQAEALLQQLAVSRGVELPNEWYRNQLGFRSRLLDGNASVSEN